MSLSRPAMMSAFLFPGFGQWAAGRRVLGALIIGATVSAVLAPFTRLFVAILSPPPCDPFARGVIGCMKDSLVHGWRVTWPVLGVCLPSLAILYAFAVWHANGLTLPGGDSAPER